MALRWRIDGVLHCAAKHGPEDRDTYINDRLHYQLAVEMKAVRPYEDEKVSGLWYWAEGRVMELLSVISKEAKDFDECDLRHIYMLISKSTIKETAEKWRKILLAIAIYNGIINDDDYSF